MCKVLGFFPNYYEKQEKCRKMIYHWKYHLYSKYCLNLLLMLMIRVNFLPEVVNTNSKTKKINTIVKKIIYSHLARNLKKYKI